MTVAQFDHARASKGTDYDILEVKLPLTLNKSCVKHHTGGGLGGFGGGDGGS
jgi:hypothetical protein